MKMKPEGDELGDARRLRSAVDRLPRELRPERDLWPGVAGRLATPPRRQFAAGWWRLAAALLLVAGGLIAAALLGPESLPQGPLMSGPAARSEPGMAAANLRQRDGVLHAHQDLVSAIARRGGRLDAAGVASLAAGLAELERATAEIEEALARSPQDRRLRLALAAAYRREAGWAGRLNRV